VKIAKVLVGLLIMIAIQAIGDKLLATTNVQPGMYASLPSLVVALIAAFAGGFIARRGMLIPALSLWLILWVYVIYGLYTIAAPTGTADILSIVRFNLVAIVSSFFALGLGTLAGQATSSRFPPLLNQQPN
jgi:hypothetical protein